MQVDRLGVHESVATVFPPAKLASALSGASTSVSVVGDDAIDEVDAVVTFEHRDAFLDGPAWVHAITAGVDRYPVEAFAANGVVLTNSTGIHDTSVGETVAGYMLAFARRLHRHVAHQHDREWVQPRWDEAFTLDGETVCVVGLGTLGRGIARHANALGMTVTGVRRSGDPVEGVETVSIPDDLDDAVADARFVTIATPLTEETRGLVDAAVLDAMATDAYLVNVARGPVVDQAALVDALRRGAIAGAALDVFETEPLPADSPLWGIDEVIVSPHCAAFTRDYYRDVAGLVRENLHRLAADEEPTNRVT